ncbi:MAG TPA: TetR/AcrR family transcriptional regulator [Caulobacteraceae bacterium]|jgi:AcrR family transcriptional regulator
MAGNRNPEAGRVGERGPADHPTRVQLLEEAHRHFRLYGYGKTSVADLARAIGVSPAYVYRFFDSKQAIGDAVVADQLGVMIGRLEALMTAPRSASERLRRLYSALTESGLSFFFNERKLHEIVVAAVTEHWPAVRRYQQVVRALIRALVVEGREAGEFERKTPVDDVAAAIFATLGPFMHPILLEQAEPDELRPLAERVADLVLRSLAP